MRRRTLLVLASILAMCGGGLVAGAASAAVLTLQPAGGGSMTSSSSPGAPVQTCSSADPSNANCSAEQPAGTVITLTASPAAGNWIKQWTGPCKAAGNDPSFGRQPTCTFTMPEAPTEVGTVFWALSVKNNSFPDCANPDYGYLCTIDCARGKFTGDGHQYWSAGGERICAGAVRSGMMSIGGGKVHSYTLGEPTGHMPPRHICYWRSSGAIWPSVGSTGRSTTITALNTASHTRHWAWGVEYETTEFFSDDSGALGFGSHECASQEGCVSDSLSTGGCPVGDGMVLYSLLTGASTVYMPTERTPFESALPVADATPAAPTVGAREAAARAAEDARLTLVGGRSNHAGIRHLSCPSGTDMLHADTAIVGAQRGVEVEEPLVDHTLRRATFTITSIPPGAHVRYQVVCRESGAATHVSTGGHIHGSTRGETHRTTRAGHHIFAGGGDDTAHATHPNAHIVGGTGNDTIFIRANHVQVMGGPGNDRIESFAPGASHMEGNAGNDTLVSHRGRTTINSQDGSPGDTVICDRGSKAIVFIDYGDTVRGPCKVAHRR